jgi:polysaccharide export outer membrane protein
LGKGLSQGCFALAAAAAWLGCSSPPAPLPPEPELGAREEYVIGAGDRLRVVVWKNPDVSVGVPVRPDGRISVPLVDDIQAEGLTALELKDLITAELDEYISAPQVSVVVEDVKSKQINVLGEIPRPGRYVLFKEHRILDVITMVGGFGQFADKSDVKIIRPGLDGEIRYAFDYDAYIAGNAPGSNLVVMPGDTIVVTD